MPRDESEETKYDAVTVETENVRNVEEMKAIIKTVDDAEEEAYKSQRTNRIWRTRSDPKNSRSPLVMVQRSIDEIDRMAQRATKAYQAVRNLPSFRDIADLLSLISLWI